MSRPDIVIRRFTAQDAEAVAALERELFAVPYDVPWPATTIAEYATAHRLCGWVATERERVVAYVLAITVTDEASIHNMGVASGRQRHGIARRLLDHALGELRQRGATTAWLEVAAANDPARMLYTAAGFTEISRRKSYYHGPGGTSDAIVMMRRLAPARELGDLQRDALT